jgi:hypothetical protein
MRLVSEKIEWTNTYVRVLRNYILENGQAKETEGIILKTNLQHTQRAPEEILQEMRDVLDSGMRNAYAED